MRVVVVGATGNVGTSLLHALVRDPAVDTIVGVARRLPAVSFAKTEWVSADVTRDRLEPIFAGADVVVALAWLIQPSRDLETLRATNVDGNARIFDAVARSGARALVYVSSVGAYSPGPKDRPVDESWPTEGIETSFYSRHKAEVERLFERFTAEHPDVRAVQLRPGLVFKREAAAEIRRYFVGPLLPSPLVRRDLIPIVPDVDGLRFQAVHSYDLGEALRLAVVRDEARGTYNIAADPVLDPPELARILGARCVPVPVAALRAAAQASWRLRLQPSPVGWVDMALGVPLMDTARARDQLGWKPQLTSEHALLDLLAGLRDGSGADTPPLAPDGAGPLRLREILTGVGGSSR